MLMSAMDSLKPELRRAIAFMRAYDIRQARFDLFTGQVWLNDHEFDVSNTQKESKCIHDIDLKAHCDSCFEAKIREAISRGGFTDLNGRYTLKSSKGCP